jgi:hypothetical protein
LVGDNDEFCVIQHRNIRIVRDGDTFAQDGIRRDLRSARLHS